MKRPEGGGAAVHNPAASFIRRWSSPPRCARTFHFGCLFPLLGSLIFALVVCSGGAFAQEPPGAPEPAPVPVGPLPSLQERVLSPIPPQFDWIQRDVEPNPLLETLLDLQELTPRLFMSATLSELYSDAYRLRTPLGRQRDEAYLTSVHLGTVYRLEKGQSFVSLANSISANYEARSERSNVAFANLALNAAYQLPRVTFALSESLLRNDDLSQASPRGVRGGRREFLRNRVSPQMHYTFSQLTAMDLGYTNTLVENDDPTVPDTLAQTINVGLQHRFSRVFSSRVSYSFLTGNTRRAADTQAHSAAVDLGYVLDRLTSLSLLGSGQVIDRSGGGTNLQSHIYGASLGLRRQLAPFLSAFMSIGPTLLERADADPRVFVNWQMHLDGTLPVLRSRLTTLTFSTQQSIDDTVTRVNNVGLVRQQSVALTLNHAVSRALQTALFGNYASIELLESSGGTPGAAGRRDGAFWRAGARAAYALTRILSLSLEYQYQRHESALAARNFDENRVTLALSSGFSLLGAAQ